MRASFLAAVVLIGAADLSQAGFIATQASFSGSESVINFSTSAIGDPLTLSGVTFDNHAFGGFQSGLTWSPHFASYPGASQGGALNDFIGLSDFSILFSTTVNRVGMLLSTGTATTWSLEAYDGSGMLLGSGSITMPGASSPVFAGFEFSQSIARVRVFEPTDNGYITMLDDLRFEAFTTTATAPEPASLALMGLGGIGMFGGWYRKRRKTLAMAA